MKIIIKKSEIPATELFVSLISGLGFFAKQFYVSASGSLQSGDILLMIAAIFAAVFFGIKLQKKDAPLLIFIIMTIVINIIYYLLTSDYRFFLSILFMIFNCIAVLLLFRTMLYSDSFLKTIKIVCKLVLLSQLVFLVTGIGKWAFLGSRYIGTFNDPNQYGFYVLSCFFCIYVISAINKEKMNLFWLILVAILILPSASTGMIATYLIFNIGFIVRLNSLDNKNINKKQTWAIIIFSLFVLLVFILYNQILAVLAQINIFGVGRIVARLTSSSTVHGLGVEFFEDRGLTRIFEMPYYFLFGSGEGGWLRFKSINNEGYEIHSTVIGLAFYYGIIPFCFLVKWVYSNMSKMVTSVMFVYIALFLEALTLINHRQPIFWLLLILAGHEGIKKCAAEDYTLRKEGKVKDGSDFE